MTTISETLNTEEDQTINGQEASSIEWLSKVLLKEFVEGKTQECNWERSYDKTK
jgi:hypothetical protein